MAGDELQKTPKLGFGLMRLPERDGKIEQERVNRMADTFLQNGFTYFDTAYVYHGGRSETAFRAAVAERYERGAYTIADKLPGWELKADGDAQRIFEEQLRRCGVSYFDYYLLHAIDTENLKKYDLFDCWAWGRAMKEKGLIRHFGFSFHDSPALLDRVLTDHPETDFVQLQINYFDWDGDVRARECYETARRHGTPVVIMEPVKGGTLAAFGERLTEKLAAAAPGQSTASWALRFCATLEGVVTVLSGMSDDAQMADNLATAKALQPFSAAERACLDAVTKELHEAPTVGCTACRYCMEGCPVQLKIPDLIREYNGALTYGVTMRSRDAYRRAAADGHGADACIACGQCEGICPQHLPVIDILRKTAAAFAE